MEVAAALRNKLSASLSPVFLVRTVPTHNYHPRKTDRVSVLSHLS